MMNQIETYSVSVAEQAEQQRETAKRVFKELFRSYHARWGELPKISTSQELQRFLRGTGRQEINEAVKRLTLIQSEIYQIASEVMDDLRSSSSESTSIQEAA